MDFSYTSYEQLLKTLHSQGFLFCTLLDYFESSNLMQPFIIIRHDVEARYENALYFAQIQHEMGIKGSYYFRLLPKSYNGTVIKQIAALGHEIGYHYDDLSHCKGNYEKAIQRFRKNLVHLREIAPIVTITMEGAPLSRYDNRDLWKKFNYKDFGILGEPYFDINFNDLFYLTDTGRRWDGQLYNVRDKATKENPITNPQFLNLRYHATGDIIRAVNDGLFPRKAMLNFHPQRWNDKPLPWIKEFILQNIKNQGKRILIKLR